MSSWTWIQKIQKNPQASHRLTTTKQNKHEPVSCPFVMWPLGGASRRQTAYQLNRISRRKTKGRDRNLYHDTPAHQSTTDWLVHPETTLTLVKGFEILGQIKDRVWGFLCREEFKQAVRVTLLYFMHCYKKPASVSYFSSCILSVILKLLQKLKKN